MKSQRQRRLDRQTAATIAAAYHNFADGMSRALGADPRTDKVSGSHIETAFASSYALFEWCRTIPGATKARTFLFELRSAVSTSLALAGLGLYQVANLQLRYACECVLSFLYFRDHPREFELALKDSDQWDLTRPKAVMKFLRKLPEFDSAVGRKQIDRLDHIYGELCSYAHPRKPTHMSQRRYLTQIARNTEQCGSFAKSVKAVSEAACGLFWLGHRAEFGNASEQAQAILQKPINRTRRKEIAAQTRKDLQC
jgi:hypothetical protein